MAGSTAVRATKHVLFALALIGVMGAFLPLLNVRQYGYGFELTAKELSFGLERTHKALDYKLPTFAEKRLPVDVRDARDDARLVAGAVKWAMALYIPALLLLLAMVLAQYRGRMGRGTAAIAILTGAASTAAWFVLRYALDYGLDEISLKRTIVTLDLGAHLLLVCGVGAVVCGLVGMIKPEPPRARRIRPAAMTPSPAPSR